jgi:hypothetical protein
MSGFFLGALLSGFSILFGWLISQSTGLVSNFFKKKKIKQGLIQDLTDIEYNLKKTLLMYIRAIEFNACGAIAPDMPTLLKMHIFSNYYQDVVLDLNPEQRRSFQSINSLLELVNFGIDMYRDSTENLIKKQILTNVITEDEGKHQREFAITQFLNIVNLLWHLKHHLNNPSNPILDFGFEKKGSYLDNSKRALGEIYKFIASSKKLTREQVNSSSASEIFAKSFFKVD